MTFLLKRKQQPTDYENSFVLPDRTPINVSLKVQLRCRFQMLNSSLETTNKLTPTFTIPAFKALPDVHNEHSIIFFLHLHSSLQASSSSGGAHSTQSFRFSATVCKKKRKKKNLQQRSQTQRKEKKKKT